MKSVELTLGRTFSVTFEHGKDFFTELKEFCAINNVKQGYIPFFIAGMSEVVQPHIKILLANCHLPLKLSRDKSMDRA